MPKQSIYTVGGTVQAGQGIYIKRKADDELLDLCRQGEFAFILSSRQVGKSSLMVRTAQQLEKEDICSVTIDLSAIGINVSQDEWYLGILNEIYTALNLETDIFGWWSQYSQLGPAQRLANFFKDVLLKEVKQQVVLFFDEIDSTLSIPFSDDFYIALRAVYNARSTNLEFKRLSFVLVGVAAPGDLISDSKRTPFNIGQRVEINDFTLAEALPLADGLGEQAVQVLTWVFQYTNGHPYLTQRLCAYLASSKDVITEAVVAKAVDKLFTGEQGKQDNNLQFVRDMLSKRSPDVTRILSTYKAIRSGKNVIDDERSITKAHLKLSGLVRSEQGILRVRNEIYNRVFNLAWVQENTPKNWQKIAVIALSAILGILILGSLGVFVNDYFVGSKRDQHFRSFISASSPEQRLMDLAEIYRRKGILSNKDSDLTASQLFYGLSTAEDQLALFQVYGIHDHPPLQNDLIIVVRHLHATVANVDPEEDNTKLLQAMLDALKNIPDDSVSKLKSELSAWVEARKSMERQDYPNALAQYSVALALNPGNQALSYERAKVYIALHLYTDALKDLDTTLGKAKESAPNIPTPIPTDLPTATTLSTEPTIAGNTGEAATASIQNGGINLTPAEATASPSAIEQTATVVTTTTAEPGLTLTPLLTAVPTYILPPKYESNFTTLIDIVNAVRTLIENTPELQVAMQANGGKDYSNLDSFGLVVILPSAQSSDFLTQSPNPVTEPALTQLSNSGTAASNTNMVLGIDVYSLNSPDDESHTSNDAEKKANWKAVYDAGIRFAYIKASENTNADKGFAERMQYAKDAGLLRGVYMLPHFELNNIPEQVDFFVKTVGADQGEMPPMVDLETLSRNAPRGTELMSRVKECLDLVEQAFGRKPIIYATQNIVRDFQITNPPWGMDYPLWVAAYPLDVANQHQYSDPNNPPIWSSSYPPQPEGYQPWTIWNWTEKGKINGMGNENVDINSFRGSLADLQQFLGNSGATNNNQSPTQPAQALPTITFSTSFPTTIQNTELSSGFKLVHFYQNDERWKNVKLGNSDETIGSWGPLITCFAMLLDGYGPYIETPATVNEKMKNGRGFQGALAIPSVIPYIWPSLAYLDMEPTQSTPVPLDQIDAFLAEGKPVILQVDWNKQAGIQTHFVLAYARKGDDYLILDPYKYSGDSPDREVLLTQRYHYNGGTLETEISAVLWFEYKPQ